MSQPLRIHHQSIFYRLDMKNLSLFPRFHAVFLPDHLNFRDTHCISYINICRKSICTLLIFIYLLCNRHPHDSHNIAFAIVFLPQMSHGSFLLDGLILIYPIILTMTLVFTRFTFRPLLSSAPFKKISSVTSWIPPSKLKKSAYNIPCNVPTLSRSLQPQIQW